MSYHQKYIKYKKKYLELKKQNGGVVQMIRLHIQNMAGDSMEIEIDPCAYIIDLKRRIQSITHSYSVKRQRLMIMHDDSTDGSHTVLDNNNHTLASYGIVNDTIIHIFVMPRELNDDTYTYDRTIGNIGNHTSNFVEAERICISITNELYVTDSENSRVQVYQASNGMHLRTIGHQGNGVGEFTIPNGICIYDDELFVSDFYNNNVQVFRASDGTYLRTIGRRGKAPGEFMAPRGLCISDRQLFVSDSHNHRIQVFSLDGTFLYSIGHNGRIGRNDHDANTRNDDGEIYQPIGVCISDNQELFVTTLAGSCIRVFRANDGEYLRTINQYGHDICILGDELFVACKKFVKVLRASDGKHLYTIGKFGHSSGQFYETSGICISLDGELFAGDYIKNIVQVFTT